MLNDQMSGSHSICFGGKVRAISSIAAAQKSSFCSACTEKLNRDVSIDQQATGMPDGRLSRGPFSVRAIINSDVEVI
jgi:hypothetical protein